MEKKSFGEYAPDALAAFLMRRARTMPVSWAGRRLALVFRKLALIRHGKDIMDTEVEGIRMRVALSGNVSERKFIFMPQFCDAAERKLLAESLSPGDVFLDIGANAGIYTLVAAKAGAKVLAFEPNPVMAARLLENVALNGFSDLVTLVPDALSDREGQAAFVLPDDNFGEARLASAGEASGDRVMVRTRCLAQVLADHSISSVAAMKIDIEGGEERVLMDFFPNAPRELYPGLIIIEDSVLGWPPESVSRLLGFGYEVFAQTRMNVILKRKTS